MKHQKVIWSHNRASANYPGVAGLWDTFPGNTDEKCVVIQGAFIRTKLCDDKYYFVCMKGIVITLSVQSNNRNK